MDKYTQKLMLMNAVVMVVRGATISSEITIEEAAEILEQVARDYRNELKEQSE